MKITYTFGGKESVFEREIHQIVIGRPKYGLSVDLDLTPDQGVSRPHARIWAENDQYWIEDLNSINGTTVDGKPIKGKGRIPLEPGLLVRISETTLKLDPPAEIADLTRTRLPDRQGFLDGERESPGRTGRLDIRTVVDASESAFTASSNETGGQRLSLLYE